MDGRPWASPGLDSPTDDVSVDDPLSRILGLPDLTADDRRRLRAELVSIAGVLKQLDRGAGFCEDRGFGWTAGMERAEGTGRVFASLRAWPILRRLLPPLRHFRHQTDPVIGVTPAPHDDVAAAHLLVDNTRTFRGRYGEGWDERTIEVTFEPDAIRVFERTVAGGIGDQPFDSAAATADYAESRSGPFWADLRKKLSEEDYRPADLLAERMARVVIPCDRCGRPAQTFAIAGSGLTYAGPFAAPARAETDPATRAALREAFAAGDLPAICRLNATWAEGFCAACDASYCTEHFPCGQ